jgi:hypothetical protein
MAPVLFPSGKAEPMRRKSVLLTAGVVVLLLGAIGTGLALLLWHEPHFYQERDLPAGPEREQQAKIFVQQFIHLVEGIKNYDKEWQTSFTEAQINSFFKEQFLQWGLASKHLPEGISDPCVVLQPDGIRVAFRYGRSPWGTVISLDMGVWLAPCEPNVIALELRGLHAGALPISPQSLLEQISEVARRASNIDVTWYRHDGNPVALLRFQSDGPQPTVQLQSLKVTEGRLTLSGGSLDPTPRVSGACPATALLLQAN